MIHIQKASSRLFDSKTLKGWQVAVKYDFREHGKVYVKDGRLVMEKGKPFTGVQWTGEFPRIDYEVALEAMRVDGEDFFCGMVFPVGKQDCSIVFGGWGGSIVGLTNIDGEPAGQVTMTLPAEYRYAREAEVLFENRKIKVRDGRAIDDFPAWTRHVYKIKLRKR